MTSLIPPLYIHPTSIGGRTQAGTDGQRAYWRARRGTGLGMRSMRIVNSTRFLGRKQPVERDWPWPLTLLHAYMHASTYISFGLRVAQSMYIQEGEKHRLIWLTRGLVDRVIIENQTKPLFSCEIIRQVLPVEPIDRVGTGSSSPPFFSLPFPESFWGNHLNYHTTHFMAVQQSQERRNKNPPPHTPLDWPGNILEGRGGGD